MKILVAIKQVPARDSQLKIASSGRWIEEGDLAHEINEPDAYALEAGLQLKEKHGGEVVALCLGPSRAGQTNREARGGDIPAGRRLCGITKSEDFADPEQVRLPLRGLRPKLDEAVPRPPGRTARPYGPTRRRFGGVRLH